MKQNASNECQSFSPINAYQCRMHIMSDVECEREILKTWINNWKTNMTHFQKYHATYYIIARMCFHWFQIINMFRIYRYNWYQRSWKTAKCEIFRVRKLPKHAHVTSNADAFLYEMFMSAGISIMTSERQELHANWLTSFEWIIYVWKCKFTKSKKKECLKLLDENWAHKIFMLLGILQVYTLHELFTSLPARAQESFHFFFPHTRLLCWSTLKRYRTDLKTKWTISLLIL